jgi:hypothetical protein
VLVNCIGDFVAIFLQRAEMSELLGDTAEKSAA